MRCGAQQVGCGVVLDGQGGLALLGRYAATHRELKKPHMEGADRLAVGREKGTWSQLLRPGVSALAGYTLLIVDSCDTATIHVNHLERAQAAGETHTENDEFSTEADGFRTKSDGCSC